MGVATPLGPPPPGTGYRVQAAGPPPPPVCAMSDAMCADRRGLACDAGTSGWAADEEAAGAAGAGTGASEATEWPSGQGTGYMVQGAGYRVQANEGPLGRHVPCTLTSGLWRPLAPVPCTLTAHGLTANHHRLSV